MSEPCVSFRLATPDDADALQAIYAPYIATPITFENSVPSVEEFRRRIETCQEFYPYIVCEEDGVPVGYAYASRAYARAGYDWSAELSVYFSTDHRGHGLGRRIYDKLMKLLAAQGVRHVIGKVIYPNERSNDLHRGMGFRLVGTLEHIGYKLDMWRDVNLWEKDIAEEGEGAPEPVLPFTQVSTDVVENILSE